jgi:heat shock protein HslJ
VWETPYDNTQPPGPTGLPQHIQINFGVTDPADVQYGDPIFYIIPKAAYVEMWDAAGDPGVKNTLALLEIVLTDPSIPLSISGMPVLPNERVPGYNDLSVQGRFFNFDKGYGVRFVGRFNQSPNPVTNEGLFYIFQGFSHDSNYLFSFFYPVTTSVLPNTAADVSTEEMGRFNQDTTAYMEERAQVLNGLAPADWDPNLETLDSLVSSSSYTLLSESAPSTPGYDKTLVNIVWQWAQFVDPNRQSVIPNPENYVVVFTPNGAVGIIADCNTGSGTYTAEGSSMTISIGAMTQVTCGEESLSDDFIRYLGDMDTYVFDNGRLVLNMKADASNLIFNNGGSGIIPPQPGEGAPTVRATEPLNVRMGPGSQYSTYGTALKGTVFEVIGKSADGSYWVVKISSDIAPDGRGWVLAAYIQAENTENVPVIEAP